MGSKMRYTFIRTSSTNENRKVVEYNIRDWEIRGCFSACAPATRAQLEVFVADREQESIKFEFDNGEMVEVRRE